MLIKQLTAAALLCACVTASAQSGLALDWQWKASHRCSTTSPAFIIAGIPAGTASLAVTMIDLDYPSYDHGGGSVPHRGGATEKIAEGALKDYRGPCPPNFSDSGHDYEFTVRAFAADGKSVLAIAQRKKNFSAGSAK